MKTKNVLLRTLMVLAVLLLCAIKASAQTKETYAFWNSTTNVLTFYYDDKRSSRTMGETYNCPFTTNAAGWYDKRDIIKEVVFDSSFNDARINSTFRFF